MSTEDPDRQREWTWQGIEAFARRVSRSASEQMASAASATTGIVPSRASVSGWLESGARGIERVKRVKAALTQSDGIARSIVFERLKGLGLEDIWPILIQVLKDIALYWGGAVVVGALVGGVAGAFFGGAGAVPGAMAGGAIGNEVGIWILGLLGLKSLVESLVDLVPAACRRYEDGFRKAWDGPEQTAARPAAHNGRDAAQEFAEGHVLLLIALLMAMVTYLTRGRGDRTRLLTEIRESKRLGPKVAAWLEKNEDQLVKHPALQKPMERGGGGSSTSSSAAGGRAPGAPPPEPSSPTAGGSSGTPPPKPPPPAPRPSRRSFPSEPDEMTKVLGVQPSKVTTTQDGTRRVVWEPNADTRIRFESHPEGLKPGSPGFNPRHHGEHYHVEMKPSGMSWNQAQKKGLITKAKPLNYQPGTGTGFLPGEPFPGS